MKARDYKTLPDTPGVYLMQDADGRILYVGKAGNLRRRVSSYFERPHDTRIERLVDRIATIDYRQTDSALEALILEADLIRKLTPPFNVKEKDDKSFLYAEITHEKFPRVILARGHDASGGKRFGPFTSASSARVALKILRKIFPWNTHDPSKLQPPSSNLIRKRPCFDYEIGLCPGTCIGAITREDYLKNIRRLELFFEGKKKRVIASLEKDMAAASRHLDFERAAKLRHQLFALKHIQDTALITDPTPIIVPISGATASSSLSLPSVSSSMSHVPCPIFRVEGYDISNISGTSAVGSMVVFSSRDGQNFEPNKNEYRKFKIKTIFQPNDVGMLTEVLERRLRNDWPLPQLMLIDGGLAQANAARKILLRAGLRIPVVGIAKGPERKRNDFIGLVPRGVDKAMLVKVRNEAHRFAINYHKVLRRARSMS